MASEQYRLSLLHSPVDPVTNSECMSKQQSPPTETVTDNCELNKHLTSGTHHFSAAEKEIFFLFLYFFVSTESLTGKNAPNWAVYLAFLSVRVKVQHLLCIPTQQRWKNLKPLLLLCKLQGLTIRSIKFLVRTPTPTTLYHIQSAAIKPCLLPLRLNIWWTETEKS